MLRTYVSAREEAHAGVTGLLPGVLEISAAPRVRDEELARRAVAGDRGALEALLERYAGDLFRYCCYRTGKREDAEDVYQETLTRAIVSIGALRDASAFKTWLISIARNLAIDVRRHGATLPLLQEDAIPAERHQASPQDRAEAGEERRTVAEALRKLGEGQQKILYLREVDGLSYAEIGRRLELSQSAVEAQLFRARRRLLAEYARIEAAAMDRGMAVA